ncbi:MAG: biotin--[acetyl-CoA-carboxylase] ligase, partial [Parvularculaceae bacterium]|nr:biotin--[acetyl-CoA-carboxylase] ligase [Parvularculaceae bacterium]
REQTAGYGRRGAAWESGLGDVAATFLFEPGASAERAAQLSFVAALAVADTITAFAPAADVRLKWPNDVLAEGGKIAGILLELIDGAAGASPLVALGIGVNVVLRPADVQYPTARLLDLVANAPGALETVDRLDLEFDKRRRRWAKEGFAEVRRDFLARADRLGEMIRVRLPNEFLEGVFKDLDPSGALVLDCGGEERRISAGVILRKQSPC